jgi:hypothetical protein
MDIVTANFVSKVPESPPKCAFCGNFDARFSRSAQFWGLADIKATAEAGCLACRVVAAIIDHVLDFWNGSADSDKQAQVIVHMHSPIHDSVVLVLRRRPGLEVYDKQELRLELYTHLGRL